jgi:hypothetical protein
MMERRLHDNHSHVLDDPEERLPEGFRVPHAHR